jgi:hypothetical protein
LPLHISAKNIKISNEHYDTSDTVSVVSTTTTSTQNTSNYHQKKKINGEDRLAKAMAKARARRAIVQQEKVIINLLKIPSNIQLKDKTSLPSLAITQISQDKRKEKKVLIFIVIEGVCYYITNVKYK